MKPKQWFYKNAYIFIYKIKNALDYRENFQEHLSETIHKSAIKANNNNLSQNRLVLSRNLSKKSKVNEDHTLMKWKIEKKQNRHKITNISVIPKFLSVCEIV